MEFEERKGRFEVFSMVNLALLYLFGRSDHLVL